MSGITPAMVGLGNVFNTYQTYFSSGASATVTSLSLFNVANTKPSDLPVSTATQTALDLKLPLNNPNMTGVLNISSTMALYNRGFNGIVQNPTSLRFSIGSTMTSPHHGQHQCVFNVS